MFNANNRNTRARCEICSKLTIKTPGRVHWRRSGVFIVNFENIWHMKTFQNVSIVNFEQVNTGWVIADFETFHNFYDIGLGGSWFVGWLHKSTPNGGIFKGTLMQIWKFTNISVFVWKEYVLKILHLNTFYFLRYARLRYVKSLFTNILKQ